MYDNRKFDVHISATGRDNIIYNNSMIDTEDRYMPYTGALGAISVSGSNNRIIGNVIKNNAEVGIKMSMLSSTDPAPSENLVAENIIENSGVLGMEVTGAVVKEPAEKNIPATQVSEGRNIIYNNNFSNSRNEFGLRVRWSNNNNIIGNTIYGNNWQGIHILSADRNLVERNTISRNSREGIWMGNSNNNKIDSNAVLDNAEHCGIIFTDWNNLVSMNNTAGNNLMSGNGNLHDEKQICDEDSNFVSGNEFK
jgi:parallel beta-helix repeat protein